MIVEITCDSPHIINAQPNEPIIVSISLGNSGNGTPGKSAYEIALDSGFVGTQVEWLASLEGDDGYTPVKNTDYFDGKSAYQLALDNGFVGTQLEWLASLEGNDGYTPVKNTDYFDGKSAYQIVLDNGFVGTQAQWLASLEGADGYTPIKNTDYFDGKSAYQIALDNGFVGTQAQWLASLQGSAGVANIINVGQQPPVTGTTANVIVFSQLIPANTIVDNSCFLLKLMALKPNLTASSTVRIYTNTTESLTGATLVSSMALTSTNAYGQLIKEYYYKDGILFGIPSTASFLSFAAANTYLSAAINFAVGQYLIVAVQNNATTEYTRVMNIKLSI